MDRFKFIEKLNFDELPKTSGVYSFYSKNELIYVGKAINIKNRVKNHFNQPSYRDDLYIEKVTKIGFLETNSEIEALILEANLIKKHQPKYNVVWKDGKNYFYVAIAQNEKKNPYVFITHQPDFSSLRGVATTKQSRVRALTPGLPRRLLAPRNDGIQYIGPFVEGNALKKTLRFLRRVFPYYTTAKHSKNKCTYCHLDLCPGPRVQEDKKALKNYKKNIKKLILILQGKRGAVLNSLKKEMKQLSKESKFEEAGKVRDRIVNLQQVMAHTHVLENSKSESQNSKQNSTEALAKILGVEKINKIECYDVSNIQGKFATGSMVVFTDGAPDKNLYRKFKIKLMDTPNDIAMLKETISRRLNHPEWPYPDVMLIDGGKAQLNVAVNSKTQSPMPNQIPKIISIAKGRQELFIEGKQEPIPLKNLPQEVYNLIKQLDDEAHRFAITYHKKLRKKDLIG
jgi:excinuclease ABC subunit C